VSVAASRRHDARSKRGAFIAQPLQSPSQQRDHRRIDRAARELGAIHERRARQQLGHAVLPGELGDLTAQLLARRAIAESDHGLGDDEA
jgi:hypothetical protein